MIAVCVPQLSLPPVAMVDGTQFVPFHCKTCPFVAPCCAKFNLLVAVPLPDNAAPICTVCVPQLSPEKDEGNVGIHFVPFHTNICPRLAPFPFN